MVRGYDDEFLADPAGYDASYYERARSGFGRDLYGYGRDFTEYDRDFTDYRRALTSYGRDFTAYGGDYEPFGGYAGPLDYPRPSDRHRRRLVPRPDWRYRGIPAGAGGPGWPGATRESQYLVSGGYSGLAFRGWHRRQPHPRGERYDRRVPPDYRRYLSEKEYGLGPGRAYDLAFRERRFRRGPLGPRNALFGGEGFRRYDREYPE